MPDGSDPPAAWSHRDEIAEWLDGCDGLVLGVDFDGTLAPIVDDPDEAAIASAAREAIRNLAAHPHVAVAVVSGRELDDLAARVDVDGAVYAGNHGLEFRENDETAVHPDAARQRSAIRGLTEELRPRLADVPGARVEDKGLTASVHFRDVPDEAVETVISAVETLAAAADADVDVVAGKKVRELRPTVEWDKGKAMRLLADAAPSGWRPMYLGDDTTDEDAFRAVRPEGVAVRVGSDTGPDTDATYQAATQEDIPRLLAWLLEYADDRWGEDRSVDTSQTLHERGGDEELLERPFRGRDGSSSSSSS